MKVTIKYSYVRSDHYPFKAHAYIDDIIFDLKISDISFAVAKDELLISVKEKLKREIPIIPESEEVELWKD